MNALFNLLQACKLLGAEGAKLIRSGGKREIVIAEQVFDRPGKTR